MWGKFADWCGDLLQAAAAVGCSVENLICCSQGRGGILDILLESSQGPVPGVACLMAALYSSALQGPVVGSPCACCRSTGMLGKLHVRADAAGSCTDSSSSRPPGRLLCINHDTHCSAFSCAAPAAVAHCFLELLAMDMVSPHAMLCQGHSLCCRLQACGRGQQPEAVAGSCSAAPFGQAWRTDHSQQCCRACRDQGCTQRWDLLTKLAALHCHPDFQLELHCWGLHPAVHGIGLTFAAELLGVAHSLDAVCRWSIQAPACTTAEVDTWGWEPNHRCARRQSPALHEPATLIACQMMCLVTLRISSPRGDPVAYRQHYLFCLCRCIPPGALSI